MIQLIAKTYTTLISPCWLCAGNTGHLEPFYSSNLDVGMTGRQVGT